ncbi:uncharacterized protein LOC143217921 isoform X2 [Lasioglossum baleicum]|uniref:uncharacterized protein LOC143217921 isoform X2 n=1 Tax=Lasioglossum baleicum TaxID=434251 RepID=UPI003FCEA2CE
MSGSRLGRGRGGRLALYVGCGVVVVLLVFLYRAATLEMARLREREIQCTHQQGALAAQLQVIFEYKTRLEKSLAEEKTSNAAVKQELQQRASREKDLRDKDGREAMQRFESLQQTYKMLQSEHQDLKEGCKKQETQSLENMNKLEGTLQKLRTHIKQLKEEKETKIRELEDLKNKYMQIDTDKTRLEETYNDLLRSNKDTDSTIQHLKKVVFQLTRELDEVKKSTNISQRTEQQGAKPAAGSSQQQQSTVASSSMKAIPAVKLETSTSANNINPLSTAVVKPLPAAKPLLKSKLPMGVPPIPVLIDQKLENQEEKQDDTQGRLKNESKKKKDTESKENEDENGNLAAQFQDRRNEEHHPDRRGWLNVVPGIQEIGDEGNHLRLSGFQESADKIEAGDDQYEVVDYGKEPQQKNNDIHLVEGEDEGEDEDEPIDYPHNLKQKRRK